MKNTGFQGDTSDAPGWLTAKADQRIAELRYVIAAQRDLGIATVMCALTDPPAPADEEAVDRWDRSCDNCGKHCPDNTTFYTGTYGRMVNEMKVMISFGVCDECSKGAADQ